MNRQEKEEWVRTLRSDLASAGGAVLLRSSGLDAGSTFSLRQDVKKAGAFLRVIKNTLAVLAVRETPFAPFEACISGPLALLWGPCILDVCKVIAPRAEKDGRIQIIAGVAGEQLLDVASVKQLAALPGLDVLRGTLVGILQAPARRIVGVVQAPAAQLARVCGAYGSSS